MRVLLIRPPFPSLTMGLKHMMTCEPLELQYLAAGLTARGHEVRLLDLVLERGLRRTLRRFEPQVVATSCYITGVNEAIRVLRRVRRHAPDCLNVIGGVHASVVPEDFDDTSVDAIALTDGTRLLPELVEAWGRGIDLKNVPGLALPTGSGVVRTAERPYLVDPDSLPMPRRDLTAHLRHRYHYLHYQPLALLKTTWGCQHRCSFCFTRKVTCGEVHSRSPESIADELETIEADDIYIVDDNFLHDRQRLARLAELLRERGIRKHYIVYGRADFIFNNEAVIREWAELGLTAVLVGLEAGSDEELKQLGKTTKLAQNLAAIQVLQRNLVDVHALLIPSPDWLPEDWARIERFLAETGLYFINLTPLTPYPGTDIWEDYADRVTLPRRAHALWDMVHVVLPTRMPLREYYRAALGVYVRTILNPWRAMDATTWTAPPWTPAFWRVVRGTLRTSAQMMVAHHHHHPLVVRLASYRGRPVRGRRRDS